MWHWVVIIKRVPFIFNRTNFGRLIDTTKLHLILLPLFHQNNSYYLLPKQNYNQYSLPKLHLLKWYSTFKLLLYYVTKSSQWKVSSGINSFNIRQGHRMVNNCQRNRLIFLISTYRFVWISIHIISSHFRSKPSFYAYKRNTLHLWFKAIMKMVSVMEMSKCV